LVFATLGRLPRAGERIELDGTVIEVEGLQGRRIASVVVTPAVPPGASQDPADDLADVAGRDPAPDGARGPEDTGPAADPSERSSS
jgi:hypothetical protein